MPAFVRVHVRRGETGNYSTEVFVDKAIAVLANHTATAPRQSDVETVPKPMFMYFAMQSVRSRDQRV